MAFSKILFIRVTGYFQGAGPSTAIKEFNDIAYLICFQLTFKVVVGNGPINPISNIIQYFCF